MKTNGLLAKKPRMARAALRISAGRFCSFSEGPQVLAYMVGAYDKQIAAVTRWHRAARGRG